MIFSQENKQQIGQLIKPSSLSLTVGILLGLIVTVGVIVAFATKNSAVQQQLVTWQTKTTHLTTPEENGSLIENDKPTLAGSWPLLVIWAMVGIGVYALTMTIIHTITNAKELTESMEYVNAKPKWQMEVALEHFVMRFVSLVIFVCLTVVLVKQVLPYSITASHAAALDVISLDGALYAVLSFAIIVCTVHLQTIFLRLASGKLRVF